MITENLGKLNHVVERLLGVSRIPGAAIAVVIGNRTAFAKGYGVRDVRENAPLTASTAYPIASTSKAINTTLLGMLVDDGVLSWDAPVASYLSRFQLADRYVGAQATLRDLVTMRTGLPRHDFLWTENSITRSDLLDCLAHLELTAGFRERFQYNNLTMTVAGHVAEVVTGRSWEVLVEERVFAQLRMTSSGFLPPPDTVTVAYHENGSRELVVTQKFSSSVIAPAGGAIHSTVEDMARWIAFNLGQGRVAERELVSRKTLAEIHAPQVVVGNDPSGPSPNAMYAMGWFVDVYRGVERLSHGGFLHGVNSSVMIFPKCDIGMVSFVNFAAGRLASVLNEYAFDVLIGAEPAQAVEKALADYERGIEETRQRNLSVPRVEHTFPSHDIGAYAGIYRHQGYGSVEILCRDHRLIFRRNKLSLLLDHQHYDVWVFAACDVFEIHRSHSFDQSSAVVFETGADGNIAAFSIRLDPAAAFVRFQRTMPE